MFIFRLKIIIYSDNTTLITSNIRVALTGDAMGKDYNLQNFRIISYNQKMLLNFLIKNK